MADVLAVKEEDLKLAASRYNSLPPINEQPCINEEDLLFLGYIICTYRVQALFGIHLAHSHYPIPDDTFLLGTSIHLSGGTDIETSIRRWAQPIPIEDVHEPIHGHNYVVRDGRLYAYEFQRGCAPDFSTFDLGPFLKAFIKAVMERGLQNLVGLEVVDSEITDVVEFIVNKDHQVLLDEKVAKGRVKTRVTGWIFALDRNGVCVLKGNIGYAPPKEAPERHATYYDGKPDAKLQTVSELASALAPLLK